MYDDAIRMRSAPSDSKYTSEYLNRYSILSYTRTYTANLNNLSRSFVTYLPHDRLSLYGQIELLKGLIVCQSMEFFRLQNDTIAVKQQGVLKRV